MKIVKVLYFASLRESLGKAEDSLEALKPLDVSSVWKSLNPVAELPEACLVAINQEYASIDSMVNAGDELAFFPPVTGG